MQEGNCEKIESREKCSLHMSSRSISGEHEHFPHDVHMKARERKVEKTKAEKETYWNSCRWQHVRLTNSIKFLILCDEARSMSRIEGYLNLLNVAEENDTLKSSTSFPFHFDLITCRRLTSAHARDNSLREEKRFSVEWNIHQQAQRKCSSMSTIISHFEHRFVHNLWD